MADLAIGFSKTVVEGLANKVQEAIKEEAEQWQIVERDLVFITGEFEMMQSFLDVADEERIRNNVVRTWVRQVRDLSYDVEDCIEFVVHLEAKQSWWLRLWNMVPSCNCCKTTEPQQRPIDQAVAEIKQLKARVEDVSQRNMRYSLISDSGSKPSAQSRSPVNVAAVDMVVEAREAASRNRGLVDLTKLINDDATELLVISLWGSGGDLGITSIIKDAYEEKEVCDTFKFRAWMKLVHPFNPQKFIRTLAAQFYTNSGQGYASPGDLGEEFVQRNNAKKYLVVLEDLCSMAEWHAVKTYLPDLRKGSRIVVSTRQLEIARLCTGRPYQVSELRKFSHDHSVCVFYKEQISPEDPKEFQEGEEGALPLDEKAEEWLTNCLPVGREWEVDKLSSLITSRHSSNKKPPVVSVWGVAGVGKSTLVQTVYYRCVKKKEFEFYGWVDVSHPFKLLSFSRNMLLCMWPKSTQAAGIEECRNLLRNHKCLVVVDGLRSKEDWDMLNAKLIRGTSKSCIVVITAEECVATHCAVTKNSVFHVNGMEVEAALELFRKVQENTINASSRPSFLFGSYNSLPYYLCHTPEELLRNQCYTNSYIKNQVKPLLSSKCGGLPSVLISLCSYLGPRLKDKREHECKRLLASFMYEVETNQEFGSLRGLLAWMNSYFHACSRSLKLCILYASIFSAENSVIIRRRRLVRRWIAEGYSKGTDSNTMVDYAEELFENFAALSMISRSTGDRATVSGCHVNGFFREYIISRPMEAKIFFPLEVSVFEGNSVPTTERVGQHLAIGNSWERDKTVFDSLDFSRLRSLTVYGKWESFFISDRMRVLRILDLENAPDVTNQTLKEISKLLLRLKFLSIRGCSGISVLPDSMGGLRQLQTLDIRHTNVRTLPQSIMKLEKMQYIRAGPVKDNALTQSCRSSICSFASCFVGSQTYNGTDAGVKVAAGIEKMKTLHTLGVVNLCSVGWEGTIRELSKLTQLRKLGVSGISNKNTRQFSAAIGGCTHLESLSLRGEHLPGITPLSNLIKMTLEIRRLTQSNLERLENHKRLQTLRIRVEEVEKGKLQFFVKPIGISLEDPFGEIKVLEIACRSELKVQFTENVMEKLELLKVDYSHAPSFKISGLQYLVSLKRVLLEGPHEGTLKQELPVAVRNQLDKFTEKPILDSR
ncbi:hypothetical protein PR202_gb13679 [Eleusine coracana subsp. coracana]|uniref:Uncharacterized protein n=1 Tax=Eleusine coracana subsp. coracana TaxID=191504 RepID=A0AAV5ESK8_ELECO|nr:hypothetical protein PR202_gb13679 [Eleusine coracana subsp. coracana]